MIEAILSISDWQENHGLTLEQTAALREMTKRPKKQQIQQRNYQAIRKLRPTTRP